MGLMKNKIMSDPDWFENQQTDDYDYQYNEFLKKQNMKKRQLKLSTIQTKVYKRFPNAKAAQDEYGLWYIHQQGDNVFDEFFMPNCVDEYSAWEQALFTSRTIQNFNRTHPDKHIMDISDNTKSMRINKRKQRGFETKEYKEKELRDNYSIF